MAVVSIKNKTKSGSLLVGNPYYIPPSFESIATATASGGESSLTFSSIPNTYQHLQIKAVARGARADTDDFLKIIINSDTGSNYTRHQLLGSGTSVSAFGAASQSLGRLVRLPADNVTANIYGTCIADFHDYGSTTKYKTFRALGGWDENGAGQILLTSGVWMNTSAITSIQISFEFGNIKAGSTFALYGIK